jgi:hypothetical protein
MKMAPKNRFYSPVVDSVLRYPRARAAVQIGVVVLIQGHVKAQCQRAVGALAVRKRRRASAVDGPSDDVERVDGFDCAVRKRISLFEFSLCLSRACLGNMIIFTIKWLERRVSLPVDFCLDLVVAREAAAVL